MKILLVEDSATLRFAMENYIYEAGHTPVIAENGETAVQMIESQKIDMILMDVEMPGLDGFETTRLIRENLNDHWIPIIFVTGESDDESFETGISVGGDDYLIKPVSKVILKAKIRAMERLVNMRDQMNKLNRELIKLSQHDSLTQLLNRRAFDNRATEAWRLATRNRQPLGVILFDIDFFKKYNDGYGHQAGDDCIKQVAQAALSCCNRPGDSLARYGGEEFVALLPDTDLDGTRHVAEELRSSIEQLGIEHKYSLNHGTLTISVGGCVIRHTNGAHLDELISGADKALYRCKHQGRNCIEVTEFRNRHEILFINCSGRESEEFEALMHGRCHLRIIDTEEKVAQAQAFGTPDLVVLLAEQENDPSWKAYHTLKNRLQLNAAPLLIMSSLEESAHEAFRKDIAASDFIRLPLDPKQTIAKISQFIASH